MAEFEHEIRERVTRIESKLDQILDMIPLVNEHTKQITRLEESTKSAHKRINELQTEIETFQTILSGFEDRIYKRAGIIAGAIGFIFFLFDRLGAK